MIQSNGIALFFTVAMLAVTLYFLFGSIPLLILKHDNPIDSRFIRSFYLTYYRMALVVAVGATASFAFAGRPGFTAGAAAIVLLTAYLYRNFLPRMEQLGGQISTNDLLAVPAFRNIHRSAITINAVQLFAILGSLAAI